MSERPNQALDGLTSEQWQELVQRLTILARKLVPPAELVRGVAAGPDDLVQETLRRFWDPSTGVKWCMEHGAPTVPGLVAYLGKVLKNAFLDLLKTGAYTHTLPDIPSESDEGNSVLTSQAERLHQRAYLRQLYSRTRTLAAASDDVEVALYLDCQMQDGGPLKNAEAAHALGVAPEDIVNIRKRLARLVLRIHASRAHQKQATGVHHEEDL